jgi:hypothetical protein
MCIFQHPGCHDPISPPFVEDFLFERVKKTIVRYCGFAGVHCRIPLPDSIAGFHWRVV